MPELTHVKGLDGLLKTLLALPPEIVSRSGGPVRTALRKAGVVFQKAARENIKQIVAAPNKDGRTPESSKTLETSIIVSRGKPQPGFKGEVFRVRVKRGARAPNGETANKYGGILEFGYEGVAAKPWLRPAFEANKHEALGVFVSEMQKRLDAAARKARKLGLR